MGGRLDDPEIRDEPNLPPAEVRSSLDNQGSSGIHVRNSTARKPYRGLDADVWEALSFVEGKEGDCMSRDIRLGGWFRRTCFDTSLPLCCLCLQGIWVGFTPFGSSALPPPSHRVNVEPGCVVSNACASGPCPPHADCKDLWQTFSCTCWPGGC